MCNWADFFLSVYGDVIFFWLAGGEGSINFCFSGMTGFFNVLVVKEVAFIRVSPVIWCKLENPFSLVDVRGHFQVDEILWKGQRSSNLPFAERPLCVSCFIFLSHI